VKMRVKYKILVIDDDEIVRETCEAVLQRGGYGVSLCATGESGLKMMEEKSFDLVLLDMLLPEMTGLEALKKIKRKFPAGMLC